MARRPLQYYAQRPVVTSIMGISGMVQLTRIGKLHLGYKVPVTKDDKNKKCREKNHPNEEMCAFCSRPVQTDYFVIGKPEAYPPGIHKALVDAYGEKPTSLEFFFPTENRALVFPQALKWYKGRRLVCKGDGQTASRVNEQGGGMFTMACPCEMYGNGCNPRASLMIALHKIKVQGCFQIDTGSVHNIVRTNSFMQELAGDPEHPETVYKSLLGRISYVPLRISLMKASINTPEGKPVEKPLWNFLFDGDARLAAKLRQRDAIAELLPGEPEVPALPPPPDDVEDGAEDTGPTINGERLPMPDEGAIETEVVKDDPTPAGPQGGEPFPKEEEADGLDPEKVAEAEKEATAEAGGKPADQDGIIAAYINGAKSADEVERIYKEHVVSNKEMKVEMKIRLQDVRDKRKRALKGK